MCFSRPCSIADLLRVRVAVAYIQNLEHAYDAPKSLPGASRTPAKLENEYIAYIVLVVYSFILFLYTIRSSGRSVPFTRDL